MRIAQLAPLAESVPPKLYGGTERVVAWLVDELVELGHDVTLFASGTPGRGASFMAFGLRRCASGERERIPIRPTPYCWKRSRNGRPNSTSSTLTSTGLLCRFLVARACHSSRPCMVASICLDCRTSSVNFPKPPSYRYRNTSVCPLPNANWLGTIQHGLPVDLFRPSYDQGTYLAFLDV